MSEELFNKYLVNIQILSSTDQFVIGKTKINIKASVRCKTCVNIHITELRMCARYF